MSKSIDQNGLAFFKRSSWSKGCHCKSHGLFEMLVRTFITSLQNQNRNVWYHFWIGRECLEAPILFVTGYCCDNGGYVSSKKFKTEFVFWHSLCGHFPLFKFLFLFFVVILLLSTDVYLSIYSMWEGWQHNICIPFRFVCMEFTSKYTLLSIDVRYIAFHFWLHEQQSSYRNISPWNFKYTLYYICEVCVCVCVVCSFTKWHANKSNYISWGYWALDWKASIKVMP